MSDFGGTITIAPGAPMPHVEDRMVMPEQPGVSYGSVTQGALAFAYEMLGYGEQWRDERMTPDLALTYSAVWACVRVIAQSIASPCWHVYELQSDWRTKVPLIDDDVAWLLGFQPNPEVNSFEWRQCLVKDALLWGNGYAEIERTGMGKPAWMWRIDPARVTPMRTDAGDLVYQIDNGRGVEPSYLTPDRIYHLKSLSADGIVGYSVVTMARRSIQLGLHEERFGVEFFGRGPLPGGILKVNRKINREERKEYEKNFQQTYGGTRRAGKVIALSDDLDFSPWNGLPNDDAQFLESRLFQANEICRWFGVPPHKVADLSRATFSNIEEQELGFVRDCLLPWARRLESEADVKLFSNVRRGRRFTRIDLAELARGNSQAQTDMVTKQVAGGVRTPNEGRAYLDLNPMPNGDELLVQGAMTTLESVVEGAEPAPVNPPAPEPTPTPEMDDAPPLPTTDRAEVRRVFGSLLTDVYNRLYRVDADKAKRALSKNQLSDHIETWYAWPAAVQRVAADLRPVFEAAELMTGGDPHAATSLSMAAAARHVAYCKESLAGGTLGALADFEACARTAVAEDVQRIIP